MSRSAVPRILLATLVLASSGAAQDDPVARALVAARTTIRVGPQGPTGDGLDFLRRETAAAQHFLIGEAHGTAEIPELVGWILEAARSAGYSTLFLETGPISQEMADEILAQPDGLDAFASFMDAHFMGIAFLGWEGEAALVADALANGWTVAGLDQEFLASGRHLLQRLQTLAPMDAAGDAARALVQAPIDAEREAVERVRRTGDRAAMGAAFLASATEATFDALDAAYAPAGLEAQRLLAEMRQSAAIYRLWTSGSNYDSNRLRVEMIKRHLREHVAARHGGDWRRLRSVAKLGGGHCARGLNSNDQYDIGMHLSELAEACGSRSFHLLVVAKERGTTAALGEPAPEMRELRPLFALTADADWTIFDLRPLRALAHDSGVPSDHELLHVIFAFDAVAVATRFSAAAALEPR
jgi:hypothetical protein